MLGRPTYLDDIRLKINRALANQYDIDYTADWFKPGNKPVEKAYQQSTYGLELLFQFIKPNQFPSLDRTSRRIGAKLLKRNLLFSGQVLAPFHGQALAALMAKTEGRFRYDEPVPEGALGSSSYYVRMRDMINDFYPAGEESLKLLNNWALVEFVVLETGEVREKVHSGEEAGTGYSAAILRGDGPSEDPALVKEQWEYARDYFIWRCEYAAMRAGMERPRRARFSFEEVVRDLVDLQTPESGGPQGDPKRLAYRAQALQRWEIVGRPYLSYAALDAASEDEISASAERA